VGLFAFEVGIDADLVSRFAGHFLPARKCRLAIGLPVLSLRCIVLVLSTFDILSEMSTSAGARARGSFSGHVTSFIAVKPVRADAETSHRKFTDGGKAKSAAHHGAGAGEQDLVWRNRREP
jgi:hypothetical protein